MTRPESTLPTMKWVYITGVAFVVTLLAVIGFVAFAGRVRMPNGLYFIILIPLGLAAAAFLFGAMRSHATYSGKSPYGTLELSGPVVVLALVVLGGMMANRAETFALTVRVHGPGGPADIVREGRLTACGCVLAPFFHGSSVFDDLAFDIWLAACNEPGVTSRRKNL